VTNTTYRRICIDCGKRVAPKSLRCRACQHKTQVKSAPITCQRCGAAYINKRRNKGEGTKYCSRECAFADHKAWRKGFIKERTRFPFTKVYFRRCRKCDRPFVGRRQEQAACSESCAYEIQKQKLKVPPREKVCYECGASFLGHGNSKFCSEQCSRRDYRKRHGHDHGKHRKRAKRAGVAYEPVNAMLVFQRDGWRCQVCGRSTPKSRRGTNHSNAPELDHRVPLAAGGPHSYDNVQCACRRCNGAKGSRFIVGQLPLFGGGRIKSHAAVS
jgi:hypothetical protein